MARVWDRFLSEQDKALLELLGGPPRVGFGTRPALLLIDNYRAAVGENRPLLEVAARRPGANGENAWSALGAQSALLSVFRERDLPVIHVTKMAVGNVPGWSYCVRHPEERGVLRGPFDHRPEDWEIVEPVTPTPREFTITKAAPSAFWGTPLVGLLNFLDVDTLVVTGEATSGCVRATVVDAVSHRFRVIVVEDGVYDRYEACHAIHLFAMHMGSADVLPVAEVIDQLAVTAG